MSYAGTGIFEIADDAVDPLKVPFRITRNGTKIPVIGLGTFGSDRFSAEEISAAVIGAAEVGYRHFDCASVYGNEKQIGDAFSVILNAGISRGELHITSKVWNDMHHDVVKSCKQTISDLGVDYLDLYLVHWPFPNFHPPGCDVDSRSPDAKPYIHKEFMKTWAQMETLVDLGLVKEIGTSNVTIPKLSLILRDARIKPAVNEMELHPHFQQQNLFDFVRLNNIVPIGFSPIGSPKRPDRDITATDTVDIEDSSITGPAQRLGVHPAVICVKWANQRGQIPIPFSVHRKNYLSNLRAVTEEPLTDIEMSAISQVDKNCRLIKGQVFLWKDNQSWEDLWDLTGELTAP
ncbi:MAG: aldo/keto reductase [Spirochaetaceae bacterium]|nr:aldo/keto reductase [Spirochaetaceae bacterium]